MKKCSVFKFKKGMMRSAAPVLLLIIFGLVCFSCNSRDRSGHDLTGQGGEKLPKYQVLDTVDRSALGNGIYADVLVESLSKNDSADKLADIAKRIAEIISANELSLYCSEDAKRANFSESYSKSHPGALEKCALGVLRDNSFQKY